MKARSSIFIIIIMLYNVIKIVTNSWTKDSCDLE